MIKAVSGAQGEKPTLWLGLSRMNTERLLANQPIVIKLHDDLSTELPDMDVVLLAGETEADIVEDMRAIGVIPPGTVLPHD